MATPIVEFAAPSGMTLTATLHAIGSDTVLKTATSVVEQTNRKGIYRATFDGAGLVYDQYQIVAKAGTSGVAVWYGYVSNDNATFSFGEYTTALDSEAKSAISQKISEDVFNASGNWDAALAQIGAYNWNNPTRTITGGGAGGAGSVSVPFTVTDNASNPIDGVAVWVSTDSSGTNVIAGTVYTNGSGLATLMLDPGSYYVWLQRNGYTFTNPQTLTVT